MSESELILLRVGIAVAMAVLLGAIIYFGRGQKGARDLREARREGGGDRREPSLGEQLAGSWGKAPLQQDELPLPEQAEAPQPGRRVNDDYDKILALYVAAKAGNLLHGQDIMVAAEKAGLTYGYMGVYHRLVDGRPDAGPIFSVANIIKPGSFDLSKMGELETPALAFFLTLPAPVCALDAWETMEPAAQRMAGLLDGVVLDQERNALGRQRIQHIREELRAYDRQHAVPPLSKPARW